MAVASGAAGVVVQAAACCLSWSPSRRSSRTGRGLWGSGCHPAALDLPHALVEWDAVLIVTHEGAAAAVSHHTNVC